MENKIRIATISHSHVHKRQQIFFKTLSELEDVQILVLGPRWWNNLSMNDYRSDTYSQLGLPCSNKSFMNLYTLLETDEILKKFEPHIIYAQTELWTLQAEKALILSQKYKTKLVFFVWENIRKLTDREKKIASYAQMIICGNKDAERLLNEAGYDKTVILPQVGISDSLFTNIPIPKEYDVLFVGRPVQEKGIDYISKACQELGLSFNIKHSLPYEHMPGIYNKAQIFCSFPFDTPLWKEQSGSYTNIEAIACKIPVVTSDAGAIPEYLQNTARICKQKNLDDLKKALTQTLKNKEETNDLVNKAYELFITNYSAKAVAKKLLVNLKQLLSVKDFF